MTIKEENINYDYVEHLFLQMECDPNPLHIPNIYNVNKIIDSLPFKLKIELEITFHTQESFDKEFNPEHKSFVNSYTTKYKQLEGWYYCTYNNINKHYLDITFNKNWEKTLIHELTHAYQREIMGIDLFFEMYKTYKNNRLYDPTEIQAYHYAEIFGDELNLE